MQQPRAGSAAPSPGAFGEMVPAHQDPGNAEASPQTLSPGELGMLMKSIQAFVPEFPNLEMGEPSTRANRLLSWNITVGQAINPAGPHLI